MAQIYCQNTECPYYKKLKTQKNYGKCTAKIVYMVSLDEESYEVSGFNVACSKSRQEREYIYSEEDE